jgi:hypothetical protein
MLSGLKIQGDDIQNAGIRAGFLFRQAEAERDCKAGEDPLLGGLNRAVDPAELPKTHAAQSVNT